MWRMARPTRYQARYQLAPNFLFFPLPSLLFSPFASLPPIVAFNGTRGAGKPPDTDICTDHLSPSDRLPLHQIPSD